MRITNITFACRDPVELARFWRDALGYVELELPQEIEEQIQAAVDRGELDATGWGMAVPPEGVGGPRLLFQRREKTETESIPIHLDLHADDRDAEVERLVGLSASVVEHKTRRIGEVIDEAWTVMRDPEGNAFCVS